MIHAEKYVLLKVYDTDAGYVRTYTSMRFLK